MNLEQRPGFPQAENQQATVPAFAPLSGTGVRVAAQDNPRRARILARGKRKRTVDPVWLQELRAK